MSNKRFIVLVSPPPATSGLHLFHSTKGLAEPLLDLRYGLTDQKKVLVDEVIREGFTPLTVFVDTFDAGLLDFLGATLPVDSRIILSAGAFNYEEAISRAEFFHGLGMAVGLEVNSRNEARLASDRGADFLVLSGSEAYGFVSSKTTLILIQEIAKDSHLPLFIRGGIGPLGAGSVFAAGCMGCILDSQILLVPESPLSQSRKDSIKKASPFDTALIGTLMGRPYRVLTRTGLREHRELLEKEKQIFLVCKSAEEKLHSFELLLGPLLRHGFSEEAKLPPVGQGIAFAKQFEEQGMGARKVLESYHAAVRDSIGRVLTAFPFAPSGTLAQLHGVRLPLVQGPMAVVTDNPGLAIEVAKGGALPFVAAGGLTAMETQRLMNETRAALGKKPFGIGIIALESMDEASEVLNALLEKRPNFAIIAGGTPEHARRLEKAGIGAYLHAPSLDHVKEFLDNGVQGIVLEGAESGGHVGALSSLVLWELGVQEILSRSDLEVSRIRLLLAGGIATARSALAAAVMASPLAERGVASGLQLGTAYLMTKEAVTSGVIPAGYQKALIQGEETIVVGQTVNLPARWLATASARRMLTSELMLEGQGFPLSERKHRLEQNTLNHMRLAVHGRGEALGFAQPSSTMSSEAAFLCGQVISLLSEPMTIAQLHEELTEGAQTLAKSCSTVEKPYEIPEDAIAIVGMGCIFPRANDLTEYWNNILNRVYAIGDVPKTRWDPDLYYDPDPMTPDKTYSKIGAFVEGFEKNPLKFRIPPVAAACIDRAQFLALEVTYQALEDAGYLQKGFPREKTGVILGNSQGGDMGKMSVLRVESIQIAKIFETIPEFHDLPEERKKYLISQAEKELCSKFPPLTEDAGPGSFASIIAGRVANCFDLGGAGFVVDGACASSLCAIDLAVDGLRSGKYDMVLAGGVDISMEPVIYTLFSKIQALSAKGSFPFDEKADGMVMGEGAGIVILKRWVDTVRDGDQVYGVIRSIGSSSDGRVKSITAPDVEGQIQAIERAYEYVDFTPDSISLVEAHGTGTPVGDEVEITSLTKVFSRCGVPPKTIALGTVKSMIGHLKAAAGAASLIKVALALHHRILPPTLCEQPTKKVDWDQVPFFLITNARPWESKEGPRRAAIDAFGFGGINYHLVLEEAPSRLIADAFVKASIPTKQKLPAEILVFRENTRQRLVDRLMRIKEKIKHTRHSSLEELVAELEAPPTSMGPILTIVASDMNELHAKLEKAHQILSNLTNTEYSSAQGIYYGERPLGPDEKIAFLFPGQGAPYVNMAGDLMEYFPFTQKIFDKVDDVTQQIANLSILSILFAKADIPKEELQKRAELLKRTDYNHPALLAMAMALSEILGRVGIRPHLVAGHSLGEYGALKEAGVFNLESAIAVTAVRGRGIYERCFQKGAMASVMASPEDIQPVLSEIQGFVAIANKNCPAQTVISGEVDAVEQALQKFEKLNIQAVRLPVMSAFHTPLLASYVEPFRQFLAKVPLHKPQLSVQSNLTGHAYEMSEDPSEKIRDTLALHMIRPVEFIQNIESMYAEGARLFLEMGPGSTLCSFVENILGDRPHWTFPTNVPRRSAALQVLHALAFCAARGQPVNLDAILPARPRTRHAIFPQKNAGMTPAPILKRITSAPAQPNLLNDALLEEDQKLVQEYLERRSEFLKGMIRLDFQSFSNERIIPESVSAPKLVRDDLEKRIIALVSEKTGYPPDSIDIDLDVEAELGLDSIKQVEIVRELEKLIGATLSQKAGERLHKISTLRALAEGFRISLLAGQPTGPSPASQEKPEVSQKEWNTRCYRWVSELVESPLSHEGDLQTLAGCRVLLLAPHDEFRIAVSHRLKELGAQTVEMMDDWPGEITDFDVILDGMSWGEDDRLEAGECEVWWERLARRTRGLLTLAQRLIRLRNPLATSRGLWVSVTSLGGQLGAGKFEAIPSLAGVSLGLSRCLFTEFPDLFDVLYVDFDVTESPEQAARYVLEELRHKRNHREIGYVSSKRHEIHWKREELGLASRPINLRSESVVLATGGARGITASICQELSRQTRAQCIVVGKSDLPEEKAPLQPLNYEKTKEALVMELRNRSEPMVPTQLDRLAWERVWSSERLWNLSKLRETSRSVDYRQCDLTDSKAVTKLVRELIHQYGRIDLVLHGAGELEDRSTEEISVDAFLSVTRAKALGTACLITALSEVRVESFVNLSSIVGRWGNMGQAPYAVGHEVASILVASQRNRRAGQWLNLLYGPWLGVGMTRLGEVTERLRKADAAFVTEQAGIEFAIGEIGEGLNSTVAFRGEEPFGLFLGRTVKKVPQPSRQSLLDRVTIVAPGIVEGSKRFDLNSHRFVSEHVIGNGPLVPAAICLEMIAQAASILADPKFMVTDFCNVEFLRALRFPRSEPREFHIRARLISKERDGLWFQGEIYSLFHPPNSGEMQEVIHARGQVRLGLRQPAPKPSLIVVNTTLGIHPLDLKSLWETKAFRGRMGMFRNLQSSFTLSVDAGIGEVTAPGFREMSFETLIENPILLDGVFFFPDVLANVFSPYSAHYVKRIESLKFFEADHREEVQQCRVRITKWKEDGYINDAECLNSMGKVVGRLRGVVKDVSSLQEGIALTEPIWDILRMHPQRLEISRLLTCPNPLALGHVRISVVEAALEGEKGEALLGETLSSEEMDTFRNLNHPKRRLEWLSGRIAAKGAVRSLFGRGAPPATDIKILRQSNHIPYIEFASGETENPFHISISHRGDVAIAVACGKEKLGIDVEVVSSSIEEIYDRFCSPQELEWVSRGGGYVRRLALTAIWAVKEAARKVIGPLKCPMKDLRIERVEADGMYLICEISHSPLGRMRAVVLQDHPYIYALCRAADVS